MKTHTHTFLLAGERNYIISVLIVHCFFFQVFKETFPIKGSRWGFGRLVLLTETRREKSVLMKEESHYHRYLTLEIGNPFGAIRVGCK